VTGPLRPEDRFTGLSDAYRRYRPGYPPALLSVLQSEYGLTPASVVADVGSGTGKLSELFLANGNRVYGVEPNEEMRRQAEEAFAGNGNFVSVNGAAEKTGLPDRSVDVIAAGTAFHWFDKAKTKTEFARVLKPGGVVALFWNKRERGAGFMRAYDEALKEHCPEYAAVGFDLAKERDIAEFFSPVKPKLHAFPNGQRFDWDGFLGRVKSTSYCPREGSPGYDALVRALRALFERWQEKGAVEFVYQTVLYAAGLPG
jgi:SAM-dependent methyltransferase